MIDEIYELKNQLYALEQERERLIRQIRNRENHYMNRDKKELWLENQLLRLQLDSVKQQKIDFEEQNEKLKARPRSHLFGW